MTDPEQRSPWDGRGLPPSAHQRLERSRGGLSASMLTVGGEVALDAVGFDPVGEVLGSCVMHVGYAGTIPGLSSSQTVTSGNSRYGGYGPFVRALDHGYATALDRMEQETRLLGAHGVVGVRLVEQHLDTDNREITAIGTAVRGRVRSGAAVPDRPFSTLMPGSETARSLLAGWMPTAIAVAFSIGVRWDDYRTQRQLSAWTNGEIESFTDLVTVTRSEARQTFRRRLAQSGATRAYVDDMRLATWPLEANGRFLVAQSTVIGGGLIDLAARRPAPTTLTVMSLKSAGRLP